MKVIIVEDENRARRGLKSLFQLIGDDYEVVADASDGCVALELIKTLRPDFVFTDIKMPKMDGMELISKVRELGISTEFIIITAYGEFELAQRAITLGVVDYLVKPIILEDLEKTLKHIEEKESNKKEKNSGLRSIYPNVHPLVTKALKEIEYNYSQKINQKELAQGLGVSAEYFSYLFSREVGLPFSKFVRHYRIEMAKKLLSDKSIPKEEVPYAVGYTEPKYFYKCFKDETGATVTAYMRENL